MNNRDTSILEEAPLGASSAGPFGFPGKASTNLDFIADPPLLSAFHGLLQAGFLVTCTVGTSIRKLLCDQFGIKQGTVEKKISTIFLDGKPVDDTDSTTVKNGATLALSGAMPGLVGATLRRKSPLASFRQTITANDIPEERDTGSGAIQIKIFNILVKDLGPVFLERGIFLHAHVFKAFLEIQSNEFWENCKTIIVDDEAWSGSDCREKVIGALGRSWVQIKVRRKQ